MLKLYGKLIGQGPGDERQVNSIRFAGSVTRCVNSCYPTSRRQKLLLHLVIGSGLN
jgi:hypothetical protein